jgi:hypothetical protein
MLYAMEGLSMPEGDVYALDGYSNDPVFRSFVKRMLLVMVNSADRSATRGALHKEVHYNKTLKLPAEVKSVSGRHLYPLMDAFERKHEGIRHYLNTGKGVDLQYLDSQIAEKVMLHFSRMNYAILPVHDSFILHHALEKELGKAMDEAFYEVFGQRIGRGVKYRSIEERQKREKEERRKVAWGKMLTETLDSLEDSLNLFGPTFKEELFEIFSARPEEERGDKNFIQDVVKKVERQFALKLLPLARKLKEQGGADVVQEMQKLLQACEVIESTIENPAAEFPGPLHSHDDLFTEDKQFSIYHSFLDEHWKAKYKA